MNLTTKQERTLEAVRAVFEETGKAVGCRELGKKMGVTHVTAWEALRGLEKLKVVVAVPFGRGFRYRPMDRVPHHFREVLNYLRSVGQSETAETWALQMRQIRSERRVPTLTH